MLAASLVCSRLPGWRFPILAEILIDSRPLDHDGTMADLPAVQASATCDHTLLAEHLCWPGVMMDEAPAVFALCALAEQEAEESSRGTLLLVVGGALYRGRAIVAAFLVGLDGLNAHGDCFVCGLGSSQLSPLLFLLLLLLFVLDARSVTAELSKSY